MMSAVKRRQVRDIIDAVRRILLDDWDPLSVGSNPNLYDEYDFFLGRIMKDLANATDASQVADTLEAIARDYLEVPGIQRECCDAAASQLFKLRRATPSWPRNAGTLS
jgi:hypothetical protein